MVYSNTFCFYFQPFFSFVDSPYYHVSRFREFDERPTVAEADSTTPEEKEYERPGEVHVGPVGANVAPDARQPNVPVPRGEQPAPPPNLAQPNPAQPNAAQPYAVVIGQLVQPVENGNVCMIYADKNPVAPTADENSKEDTGTDQVDEEAAPPGAKSPTEASAKEEAVKEATPPKGLFTEEKITNSKSTFCFLETADAPPTGDTENSAIEKEDAAENEETAPGKDTEAFEEDAKPEEEKVEETNDKQGVKRARTDSQKDGESPKTDDFYDTDEPEYKKNCTVDGIEDEAPF
ncbi:hypothetical protein CRE_21881 [Caenorhabditis remanei]|uniref:Uncharacterized protein n=1 Tax=Caenorhabditis remanei TaxID=31234 RepID=E3MUF7_CAERE|nr:hypothetical protein CRE_21881 [Caenorhabditis remanei]